MKLTLLSSALGVTLLECEGEITQNALWKEDNPLERILGESGFSSKVLISLDKADYIDSAGVGWFIVCHRKFRDSGGMLVLHSIPPMVSHIFQLLKMDTVLHLVKDEKAARALIEGGRP